MAVPRKLNASFFPFLPLLPSRVVRPDGARQIGTFRCSVGENAVTTSSVTTRWWQDSMENKGRPVVTDFPLPRHAYRPERIRLRASAPDTPE